jgi:SAM-dependent methyltransferase
MKSDFLNFLECQSCKSGFEVKDVYSKKGNDLVNAVIACQCSSYPVLGGIPIIKKPAPDEQLSSSEYIIQRLRSGKIEETMALPFEGERSDKALLWLFLFLKELGPFKRSLNPMLSIIRSLKRNHYKKYVDDKISFFQLLDTLSWGTWGDYLKHRFSCNSFWPLYPFMPLVKEKNEMVLDLLCGAGHGSFVISQSARPKRHVSADFNYTLLYVAKRYFAPHAEFICLDGNDPLPFKDGIFSSLLMMDSTHYVSNRVYLGKECQRTVKSDGAIIWLHLHNGLSENPSEGYALPPSKWADLLKPIPTTIFSENRLIDDYLTEQRLDLNRNHTGSEIDSSGSLCIIGSHDKGIIRTYENIEYPTLSTNYTTIINPIYEMDSGNGNIKLTRSDVNEVYKKEYSMTFEYLPPSYTISGKLSVFFQGNQLKIPENLEEPPSKELKDMLRKFIILNVPEEYV